MSYPQQPGNWQDPSWPAPGQPHADPGQPYADPGYGAGGYPGYQPSAVPASPGYGYGYQQVPPSRPTNGLAIASLVTSLVGLTLCGVPGVVGAIMGHVARRQIRERGEDGDGMALAGVLVGWISFALVFLGFVLVIVLPLVGLAVFDSTYDGSSYDDSDYD
jgi:hypothetical protein